MIDDKAKRKGVPWYWLPFYDTSKEINKFLQYWGFAGSLLGLLWFVGTGQWITGNAAAQLCMNTFVLGFWLISMYFFLGSILSKHHLQQAKIKHDEVA
jgi:hypothetical protein